MAGGISFMSSCFSESRTAKLEHSTITFYTTSNASLAYGLPFDDVINSKSCIEKLTAKNLHNEGATICLLERDCICLSKDHINHEV
jgi:hypothetical protein